MLSQFLLDCLVVMIEINDGFAVHGYVKSATKTSGPVMKLLYRNILSMMKLAISVWLFQIQFNLCIACNSADLEWDFR